MKAPPVVLMAFTLLAGAGLATAHPMGNFSVNHYARLEPGAKGLIITYVLDLAELPTVELIQSWGVERTSPQAVMEAQAAAQARQWAASLKVTENGKPLLGILQSTLLAVETGAGGIPLYRISTQIRYLAHGGKIEFEDNNYATRAGWREIVVRPAVGGELLSASVGSEDRSEALTLYPKDQEKAPPQDSKAWLEWNPVAAPVITSTLPKSAAAVAVVESAAPAPLAPSIRQSAADSSPLPPVEPGHEYRNALLLALLIAALFVARKAIRSTRYPVA